MLPPPPSFRLPHLPYSRQSPWLFFLSQAGFGSGNEKRVGSIREEVLKYWIGYFRVPPFLSGISRYIAIVGYFQVFQVLREVVKNGHATVRGGGSKVYPKFWVYPKCQVTRYPMIFKIKLGRVSKKMSGSRRADGWIVVGHCCLKVNIRIIVLLVRVDGNASHRKDRSPFI